MSQHRAIVVGSSSMLGKRLITVLKNCEIEVITCGRDKSNDIILDLSSSKNVEFSDDANANYIFNCAASFENDSVHGLAKYSGFIEHLEPVEFADSFFDFINDQKKLKLMKKKSMETFDGFGIPRMIEAIRQL
ncbi:hypothetical protein OAE14_00205 [Alphaproteobacteria bacterium]|nr:hypothetical protein [Alphaproteobacteria bacterium]